MGVVLQGALQEFLSSVCVWFLREVLRETLAADGQHHRDKWTLFGNEAEKVEVEVIRNQQQVRKRDRKSVV